MQCADRTLFADGSTQQWETDLLNWSRRNVLAAGAASALAANAVAASTVQAAAGKAATGKGPFPASFLWGAATAGHQVEGQNVNSDIWLLEHVKPSLFQESSGDGCASLQRWEEDLDIVRSLGLNTYRFSLEWARIEPAEGEFSAVMLDHYKRVIAGCRDRGLVPLVTFNHFTAPRWFAAQGGWEVATAPAKFTRFCDKAARYLAADIGYATTLNEPNLLRMLDWLPLPFPPSMKEMQAAMLKEAARQCGSDRFSAANCGNADAMLAPMIAGHKAAVAAIKSANPSLPVGVSLAISDDQPIGKNSRRDAKRREVYGEWLQAARETCDFIGVQTYSRSLIDSSKALPPPKGATVSQMGEEYYPAAIEGTIRYAHAATGLPVMVTENGVATTDDAMRAAFIPEAIAAVGRAMAGGVPVLGYVHWSLLDNFEWLFGYTPKFGLVAVDRTTMKRTIKPSARIYGAIAAAGGLTQAQLKG